MGANKRRREEEAAEAPPDVETALAETFGAAPAIDVPPRDEWDARED